MSLIEETELLRRIPLFAEIEPAKLKLLALDRKSTRLNSSHI